MGINLNFYPNFPSKWHHSSKRLSRDQRSELTLPRSRSKKSRKLSTYSTLTVVATSTRRSLRSPCVHSVSSQREKRPRRWPRETHERRCSRHSASLTTTRQAKSPSETS